MKIRDVDPGKRFTVASLEELERMSLEEVDGPFTMEFIESSEDHCWVTTRFGEEVLMWPLDIDVELI